MMQEKALKILIKDFYKKNMLSREQEAKILSKLPMSQASTPLNILYKVGVGVLGVVVFMAGFFIAMPQKAVQYTPDAMLQYIPAKTQVAYVEDQEKAMDEAKQVIDEVDSFQKELDAIDAELSALDNLQ